MPFKANRFYNDPALGQVFENLSTLFAPPSAQDTAAYATAKARSEEAARQADAYRLMTSEDASPELVDRYGVAIGRFNPTQSYHALEMGDATARRGQDIESGDRRYGADQGRIASMYGSDRTYAASRENNTADNTRAVQTNAADNARAIATNDADNARALTDRQLQEDGSLARLYAAPVKVSQGERAFLPAQTAAATGLAPQLNGADKPLSTDEVAAMAMQAMPLDDRQQFVRDKFAPTETQVQGQERRDLRARGLLPDGDLVSTIMGETPLEEVVGAEGKAEFVRRPDAVGRQPAPRSPTTVVNTGAGGDAKLREKLDENEGKRWSDLQAAAVTASGLQQDLGLLDGLVDQAPQGMIVGRLAEYFPEATTAGAAFQSIVSRAAPGLRVEGSGATSDIEYNGMVRSLPRLRNDPEANRLIIGMMRQKAEINVRRGELISDYQNGRADAAQTRDSLAALNRQSILSPGLRSMIERAGGFEAEQSGTGNSDPVDAPVYATNPTTGERLMLRNGQWEKAQ